MDIEALVDLEAPNHRTQEHDKYFAYALRAAHKRYQHMPKENLKGALEEARKRLYAKAMPEHATTASVVVLYALCKENDLV